MPRVILLVLDGFPDHALSPEIAPRLWALSTAGGRATGGGRCPLPSSTYPCHATLLTGRLPEHHGVRTNLAASPRPGVVPGWAGQPRAVVPTLFEICRAARVHSAAILGDYKLYPIIAADAADHAWPAGGTPPADARLDAHGYLTNEAVRPHLLAAAEDPAIAFLFGHLNEPDTWGHTHGPGHPETLACYTATDTLVGEVLDALRDDWERTVVIVVSDHGMEPPPAAPPVDLLANEHVRTLALDIINDGGCALARLRPDIGLAALAAALAGVPGVGSWTAAGPDLLLVEAQPGHIFSSGPYARQGGFHGGPSTTRTLAVVGGGHPAVAAIATAIQSQPPHLADWAPTITTLFGLTPAEADGRNLLPGWSHCTGRPFPGQHP